MSEEDKGARVTKLDDKLFCKTRRTTILLETCLDNFVDAGAFHKESSACYGCRQGADNRRAFASSTETGETRADLKRAFAISRNNKRRRSGHRVISLIT